MPDTAEEPHDPADAGDPDGDAARDRSGPGGTPDEPVFLAPETFDDFVEAHDLVLVDVWAEWCGPCRRLDPAVEAVAAEPDVAVGKIDYDAHPDLADDLRSLVGKALSKTPRVAWGLPSLFVLHEGDVVERSIAIDTDDETVVSERGVRELLAPYR